MAVSPAHKFGQIIGDVLENTIKPVLEKFAQENNLYFDKQGPRKARPGLKVSWTDSNGNTHDLDYVIERGGNENQLGTPVAFIESAWRRYTKHSRNKAQEIQGAILPLRNRYSYNAPFIGVILAGVFTEGAIDQLKSLGFQVLYFEYPEIIKAFNIVGIDATFKEDTSTKALREKIRNWNNLTSKQKDKVSKALLKHNSESVTNFINALQNVVTRRIQLVRILPLYGRASEYTNIQEAIKFVKRYNEKKGSDLFTKYEVEIRYTNNNEIRGTFGNKQTALEFLTNYL